MGSQQVSSLPSGASKDLSLEAVRGIASIIVFTWHFFFAFDPGLLFLPERGLVGSPIYAFFHGTAAVDLFFTLSGFVLTRHFFEIGANSILIKGVFKRWFRLMPLALISILFSWICYHFGLYFYVDAGEISRSGWLIEGSGASPLPIDPNFLSALWQGMVGVFFGEINFNTNLWTIKIEFFGSLIAFAYAGVIRRLWLRPSLLCLATIITAIIVSYLDLHYLAFLVGPLLAANTLFAHQIKAPVGLTFLLAGLFLMGYRMPTGCYSFMEALTSPEQQESMYVLLSLFGSGLIIRACSKWTVFNKAMQKPWARSLGRLSFPLYAIHIVMIGSLGSAAFLYFSAAGHSEAVLMTAFVLVPATFLFAALLALFDGWWVGVLTTFCDATFEKVRFSLHDACSKKIVKVNDSDGYA